jgi:DNA-binding response OmpR family regulator
MPEARFDAVILDVGLPDGDGRDYCVRLRGEGHRMPIIMLTGSNAENDVVRGLDSGANDYISKPFRLAELLARLRAQLRSFESSEDAVFAIGPYMFRPAAKLLQDPGRGRRIRLTEKEAAILKFLYRAGTHAVARQVLLNEVWGYNASVTTHTLETHIYRLRQKIEPDPGNARLLITEGGGYRLDPEGAPAIAA